MPLKVLENRITSPMMFTLVRDQIADILENELANQVILATAASAPTEPYEISVTVEKTDPWNESQFPLVNVWYDSGSIDANASSPTNQQQGDHFYNLDCYVEKPSEDDSGEIISGDTLSAKEVQRVAGLIWQIIMSDQNTRLQFASRDTSTPIKPAALVAHRIIEQINTFQPSFGDTSVQNFQALRLRLKVRHVEIPPVSVGVTLHEADLLIIQDNRTLKPETEINIPFD